LANRIHPTAIIGDGVELGDDNVIGPYSVIVGPCRIGNGNWIGPHVSLGGPAEYKGGPLPVGWEGELGEHGVVIGDRNTFREYVSVNQGYEDENTIIGDDNYFMGQSHVAHDCVVHDNVTMTSSVQLAGHCHIWSWVNLGLGTVVHQRNVIGPGAMVGMGSVVRKPVGPFVTVFGNPARVRKINAVGLSRRGCDEVTVAALEPYLLGTGPLPDGLPEPIAGLLKAWDAAY
jgi:UDP-N-acetylglucosamine acyltransferase